MKITTIETFKYWAGNQNWLLVKVSTDEGLYGWGEGSLLGAGNAVETAIHELGAALIGQDPGGVERHWQRVYNAWRYRGGIVLSSAQAALDVALWDIEGKRLGVPVYRLLGGPFRERLRVYFSHCLWHVSTPEEAYEGALQAVSLGFTAFKWNPFMLCPIRDNEGRAIARATELMAAARQGAGPDVDIFVDCVEALSPRTAVAAAKAFEPYRPGWFEEPIPFENAKAMIQLQREMPVPIATGERLLNHWEYRELLEGMGCHVVQPELAAAGGITEVRRIATLANTYYRSVAPHNGRGPISGIAAIHLSAAIPNFYILEQMEHQRQMRDSLCTVPVQYKDGHFELPTGPGLGTDIRMDVLQAGTTGMQPMADTSETRWF